jgi:hypothetical protein
MEQSEKGHVAAECHLAEEPKKDIVLSFFENLYEGFIILCSQDLLCRGNLLPENVA